MGGAVGDGGDGGGDDAENNSSQPLGPSPPRPRMEYPVLGNSSLRYSSVFAFSLDEDAGSAAAMLVLCPMPAALAETLGPHTPRLSQQPRINIAVAGAVDREFGHILRSFEILGRKRAHGGPGGVLRKRFLEAVGFILAKFEPKRSHGDPVRGRNCGFGTDDW